MAKKALIPLFFNLFLNKLPMNILYAKKFRFPDESANMIQGLNMVAAFSLCGTPAYSYLTFAGNIRNRKEYIKSIYGIHEGFYEHAALMSQHMRGIRYPLWLLNHALFLKHPVLYTREGAEARRAVLLRHFHFSPLPLFHEIHKYDIDFSSNSAEEKKKIHSLALLLSQANGLIFISEVLQRQAQEILGISVPSCVAPSGVNLSCFKRCVPPTCTTDIVIGYFGKLVEEKGVKLLVETFRLLPDCYHLRLIGKVDETIRNLLLFIAGPAASRIHFTGHVNHADLADAMQGVHISVIPSVLKTQFLSPLKLAESMAMGLPIVCTPIPHLQKLLKKDENAVFASDTSPSGLAAAIKCLGNSPKKLLSMSEKNLRDARKFSWEARAQHILQFMKETLIQHTH